MEEITNPTIDETDVKLAAGIYLRIRDTTKLTREVITGCVGSGILALSSEIYKIIANKTVCYEVNQIDFNHADFQEEGLYCATQEWIATYYSISIQPIEVNYDSAKNKYIFHIPDITLDDNILK